jgi:hypothetical protein
LNESYVLILNAVVLSVGNFALWWTLFDEQFIERLNFSEKIYHDRLKQGGSEQLESLNDPNDVLQNITATDNMTENSLIKNTILNEARALQKRTIWVYYFALGAILFATIGLLIPKGIVFSNLTVYVTSLSWWILVIGVLCMLGLLINYQLIEHEIIKPPEGERIKGYTGLKSLMDLIRRKLPI